MTRGLVTNTTRRLFGLVPQLVRGFVGQAMASKPLTLSAPIADLSSGLAVNGWSFRKIRDAYTGPCVRLLRISDSAQLDFRFTAQNYVDVEAINTWLGASSARVVNWYDQIGSNNWNSAGTNPPDLVISGPRVWVNINTGSFFDNGPSLTAWTALVVGRPFPAGEWRTLFWNAAFNSPILIENSSTRIGRFQSGFAQFGSQTWGGGENASFYLDCMTTLMEAVKNNGPSDSVTTASASVVPNVLGANNDSGGIQPWGRIDELVFFNAKLNSGLRSALNANQRDFYGVL